MADKSPRQHLSKKAGKSLKEKRVEKHAKADTKNKVVPPRRQALSRQSAGAPSRGAGWQDGHQYVRRSFGGAPTRSVTMVVPHLRHGSLVRKNT